MYKLHNIKVVSVTLSVLTAVFAVSVIAFAATSIGTNLSVDGTATITGASTFTGDVTANGSGTFGNAATDIFLFTGDLHASTTALFTEGFTTYGNSTFGDASTDINLFTGPLHASTTALFTEGFTTYGNWTVNNTATTTVTFGATGAPGLNFDANTLVVDAGSNRVGVSSSTPAQELGVVGDIMAGSAATTTVQLTTSSATIGGCIELKAVDGTTLRIYATSSTQTGTLGGVSNLMVEAGRCQ